MNIPEGYVLVPVDPIKAIDMGFAYLDAAREAEPNKSHSFSHAGYRAMIAAAPAVDVQDYDEAKERELFETAYPLDNGVTWVKDMGKTGSYAVRINSDGGFWACVNAAYQLQIKWEVWSKCAKSRARSAE